VNFENVRIALRGVSANRLRSGLTMLGILIGVAAVIVLVAVGNGSSAKVQRQLQSLGTNTLTVLPGGFGARGAGNGGARPTLTVTDVTAISDPSVVPDVAQVAPVKSAQATGSANGNSYQPGQILGTTSNMASIRDYQMASGIFFTEDDVTNHRRVVLLGSTVVKNLFGTDADPTGQAIKLGSATWEVGGVLKPKGTNGLQDQDDVIIAPITALQDNLTGNNGQVSQIVAQATSRKQTDAASAEISAVLASNHKTASGQVPFQVLNQASLVATSQSTTQVFTVLLGAVAAISLLVGGIGVMNIMLVTVTERTREIGIRKAVGARRWDILGQFMVEAVLLTVLGGMLGVLVGIAGSQFAIVGVQPVVAPGSVLLAFSVACIVGLFFGIYPANRAASLSPIDALRYE
jgi:putative ABC transport system permease protein